MNTACACSSENRPVVLPDSEAADEAAGQPSQIDWKGIWKPLTAIVGAFLVFFWLPIESARFMEAVMSSLALTKWYAQEHVLLCLGAGLLHRRRHIVFRVAGGRDEKLRGRRFSFCISP